MIQGDACESGGGQSRGEGCRLDGHECAVGVDYAVEPSIRDFKSKEAAAWLQDAVNFREGAILERARTQMMQHEDGDGRGEGAVGERQSCRVALHNASAVSVALRKSCGECMVVFETGYARIAPSQLSRGGAWACANFQKVIAHVRSAQHKRQDLIARYPSPKRGRAEPVLEGVHRCTVCGLSERLGRAEARPYNACSNEESREHRVTVWRDGRGGTIAFTRDKATPLLATAGFSG